jgi:general secretion pathway protein G
MTIDLESLKTAAFTKAPALRRMAGQAGFTLIEILLVIVIILLLAGALVIFVLPQQEGAEKNTTKLKLEQVSSALDTYRLNMGHYPKEDEGGLDALMVKPTFENEKMAERWRGPYLKPGVNLEDAWGHKLRYEVVDRATTDTRAALPYKLSSSGPDGQPDTEDDIRISTETDTSGGSASTADQ